MSDDEKAINDKIRGLLDEIEERVHNMHFHHYDDDEKRLELTQELTMFRQLLSSELTIAYHHGYRLKKDK